MKVGHLGGVWVEGFAGGVDREQRRNGNKLEIFTTFATTSFDFTISLIVKYSNFLDLISLGK